MRYGNAHERFDNRNYQNVRRPSDVGYDVSGSEGKKNYIMYKNEVFFVVGYMHKKAI